MRAVRCVGLSVFQRVQKQTETHVRPWMLSLQGQFGGSRHLRGPEVSSRVCLLADVAAGSDRAGAARAPVAAGSQKSRSCIINASSLLA